MKQFSKLSFPRLGLPPFTPVRMFRALDQVLRTDPAFSTACNTFLSWTGTTEDAIEPTFGLCPYCRISPIGSPWEMVTEAQHSSPVFVDVVMAIQGLDFDQLGNFWGLLHYAIYPQNNPTRRAEVMTVMQTAGITRPVDRMTAFNWAGDNTNNYMMIGQGSIYLGGLTAS